MEILVGYIVGQAISNIRNMPKLINTIDDVDCDNVICTNTEMPVDDGTVYMEDV